MPSPVLTSFRILLKDITSHRARHDGLPMAPLLPGRCSRESRTLMIEPAHRCLLQRVDQAVQPKAAPPARRLV